MIRSTAFQEAGWSPEYTLTEDYALGMELTRLHWHCRYVNEYLAIGEAPHETRNCFQQRSRWCKVRSGRLHSLRLCCDHALAGAWRRSLHMHLAPVGSLTDILRDLAQGSVTNRAFVQCSVALHRRSIAMVGRAEMSDV